MLVVHSLFQLNIKLIELLVEAGGTVTSHKSDSGKTILHLMSDLCMDTDLSSILRILVEQVIHSFLIVRHIKVELRVELKGSCSVVYHMSSQLL